MGRSRNQSRSLTSAGSSRARGRIELYRPSTGSFAPSVPAQTKSPQTWCLAICTSSGGDQKKNLRLHIVQRLICACLSYMSFSKRRSCSGHDESNISFPLFLICQACLLLATQAFSPLFRNRVQGSNLVRANAFWVCVLHFSSSTATRFRRHLSAPPQFDVSVPWTIPTSVGVYPRFLRLDTRGGQLRAAPLLVRILSRPMR